MYKINTYYQKHTTLPQTNASSEINGVTESVFIHWVDFIELLLGNHRKVAVLHWIPWILCQSMLGWISASVFANTAFVGDCIEVPTMEVNASCLTWNCWLSCINYRPLLSNVILLPKSCGIFPLAYSFWQSGGKNEQMWEKVKGFQSMLFHSSESL